MSTEQSEILKLKEHFLAEIDSISRQMPPQPDADGKIIPNFLEWTLKFGDKIFSLLAENPKNLLFLKQVYHSQIYDRAKPSENPIRDALTELNHRLAVQQKKLTSFKAKEIPDLKPDQNGLFMGSDGEFYSEQIFNRVIANIKTSIELLNKLENVHP